ncbi:MAG: cytochrome c [Gammaproteobacteria bacterium]|nr:cytochrome c [Gammaproteobacteria bacterium]
MQLVFVPVTFIALSALAGYATGADFEASSYHEQHCTRCHGSEVYTRDNRRVQSYQALHAQVSRCDANLATGLFPDDIDSLVEHLNDRFYRFDK